MDSDILLGKGRWEVSVRKDPLLSFSLAKYFSTPLAFPIPLSSVSLKDSTSCLPLVHRMLTWPQECPCPLHSPPTTNGWPSLWLWWVITPTLRLLIRWFWANQNGDFQETSYNQVSPSKRRGLSWSQRDWKCDKAYKEGHGDKDLPLGRVKGFQPTTSKTVGHQSYYCKEMKLANNPRDLRNVLVLVWFVFFSPNQDSRWRYSWPAARFWPYETWAEDSGYHGRQSMCVFWAPELVVICYTTIQNLYAPLTWPSHSCPLPLPSLTTSCKIVHQRVELIYTAMNKGWECLFLHMLSNTTNNQTLKSLQCNRSQIILHYFDFHSFKMEK